MDIRKEIEQCKTPKQVFAVLEKNNLRVWRDDSDEVGCFSIWLDEKTRIYKPHGWKTMAFQTWTKSKMEYSGVPVFFG